MSVVVVALAVSAGCGDSTGAPAVGLAGGGALIVSSGPDEGGHDAGIGGPVTWVGPCLGVGGTATIWPRGTEWDPATSTLTVDGGAALELGDEVNGAGGFTNLDAVAATFGRSAADDLTACGVGEQDEIAFFDVGSSVRHGPLPP